MKHANEPDKAPKHSRGTGFYIALFLCAAAIGISGYVVLSAPRGQSTTEENLTLPISATVETEAPTAAKAPEKDKETQIRQKARQLKVAPVRGDILRGFSAEKLSYNKATRDWRLHDGVDIAAQGQNVMVCMAGTVEKVYEDDYLGTTVIVSHDDGYTSQYSNLTAMPTVKAGDEVAAGDIIGAVGNTSLLESGEEPHLHFCVMCRGQSVDPMEFING